MSQLVIFNSIINFVKDLNDCFGTKLMSLQLYNRILEKTTVSHKEAISKHIKLFSEWSSTNKQSILDKKYNTLIDSKISYSEKVYIDFDKIFEEADKDQESAIWKHILTICAYTNPDINAKQILKQDANNNSSEKDFLQNMIDKVEENVGDADNLGNPMQAVASMMSSGIFNELVGNMTSGLQNGNLNLSKLMGTVNTMVSSIADEMGDEDNNEEMSQMMNSLTGLVEKMNIEGEKFEKAENQ